MGFFFSQNWQSSVPNDFCFLLFFLPLREKYSQTSIRGQQTLTGFVYIICFFIKMATTHTGYEMKFWYQFEFWKQNDLKKKTITIVGPSKDSWALKRRWHWWIHPLTFFEIKRWPIISKWPWPDFCIRQSKNSITNYREYSLRFKKKMLIVFNLLFSKK